MDLRNIAIIAHVDHGKTTLVDELLTQSGVFREGQAVAERAMDSNDLERERGITILAKCTSVDWKGTRINIVDTPGHADFGGEVERILSHGRRRLPAGRRRRRRRCRRPSSYLQGADARPAPDRRAQQGRPPDADPDRALNEVFDLFADLGADDDQLDFPHLYASGRAGWADDRARRPAQVLAPLFDLIVHHVPAPRQARHADEPFQMLPPRCRPTPSSAAS